MRPIGLLGAVVAVVCLLPATLGAQERLGGRVFEVDPNPAPHVRAEPQERPQPRPDSGKRRFDEPRDSAPGPALAFELVRDGSFEEGTPNPSWTEASTNFGSPLCSIATCGTGTGTGPHTGTWWTWFGGIMEAETASVEQEVLGALMEVCSLSFWLEIPTASGNGVDFMNVRLDGQIVFSVLESDPGFSTYTAVRMDVSDIIDGTSQLLRFESSVTGTGADVTNFFVDDVSLGCEPFPTVPPPGLFSGTGDFGGSAANPAYTVSEHLGSSRGLFAGIPVWGAAYVESTNTIFFTTSTTGSGDEDGSQMMIWTGGLPIPFCTLTEGGDPIRIDGLAFDPASANFFMVHQFGDTVGPAGIYSSPNCTDLVQLVPIPDGVISGIAYDPVSQTLYGVQDFAEVIVSIDTTSGVITTIDAYPAGVTDLDGLAYDDGKLYLVPDDPIVGLIFVYDLGAAGYLDPLPAPWMNDDTFSGATFVPGANWGDGFESGDLSAWSTSRP